MQTIYEIPTWKIKKEIFPATLKYHETFLKVSHWKTLQQCLMILPMADILECQLDDKNLEEISEYIAKKITTQVEDYNIDTEVSFGSHHRDTQETSFYWQRSQTEKDIFKYKSQLLEFILYHDGEYRFDVERNNLTMSLKTSLTRDDIEWIENLLQRIEPDGE